MQYTQSRLLPRFTEKGFDLIQIPLDIYQKLKHIINQAVLNLEILPYESGEGSIYGPNQPKFVELGDLRLEVLEQLKQIHEEWAGR